MTIYTHRTLKYDSRTYNYRTVMDRLGELILVLLHSQSQHMQSQIMCRVRISRNSTDTASQQSKPPGYQSPMEMRSEKKECTAGGQY